MNPITKFSLACGLSLAITSLGAQAAPSTDNPTKGHLHGKPFLALSQQIGDNLILIEENRTAINTLETHMVQLVDSVNTLDAQVTQLASDVEVNRLSLEDAWVAINATTEDLNVLISDMRLLEESYQLDLASMETKLSDIQTQMTLVVEQSAILATDLSAKIAEVKTAISENSTSVDSLMQDVILLNAELTTINAMYAALEEGYTYLSGEIDVYDTRLDDLETDIQDLERRVTTLEGFHVPEAVCGAAGELCSDLPWVFVDEVNGLAWAWASPCSGGCSEMSLTGRNNDMVGWRYATESEWLTKPDKNVFGGSGFRFGGPGDVSCASPFFDLSFNHCDYINNPVRVPDGGISELWIVHDLYDH